MKKLDPVLLHTFVSVIETGTFTAAGDRIGLTQSAVSMHIRRLEDTLGVPVLDRSARDVQPTAAGETLLDYARRILALQAEALERFSSEEVAGSVRIGTCDDFASTLLPPALDHFSRQYPRVRAEIVADTTVGLRARLERGEVDLAFVLGMSGDALGRFVCRERIVWVTARDRPAHRRRPLPLALFHDGCVHRHHAIRALDHAGIDYTITATSISKVGIDAAVHSGMAVSAIAHSGVTPSMRVLTARDGVPDLPDCAVFLVQSSSSTAGSALEPLAHYLVEAIGAPDATGPVTGFARHSGTG